MLLAASSFGGSYSFHDADSHLQSCRGAVGCAAVAQTGKRRSDLARTAAEVLVADLNRPAHGTAVGRRFDCATGIARHVSTLLAGLRLRAAEGGARRPLMGGIDFVGRARVSRLRAGRQSQTYRQDG